LPGGKDPEAGPSIPNVAYLALEQPWRAAVPRWLRSLTLLAPGKAAEQEWIRWMERQVSKAPIAIVTFYDWIWWMGFSCKFQTDTLHIFFNHKGLTQAVLDSVQHFYVSDEWQQWTCHNHGAKMTDKLVWASHKEPLKKYILDYDGDTDFYKGKIKVKSAHSTWGYQLGIASSTLHVVHFGRLSVSHARFMQKYGAAGQALRHLLDDGGCACDFCVAHRTDGGEQHYTYSLRDASEAE
jgi:hypothetical protein